MPRYLELLLVENVDNLGIVGDVVKVKPGYARNYLLPRGLAEPPTDEKIAALAERRAQIEAELAQLAEQQKALIERLENYELTLERATNDAGALYGGVSQHDVAQALRDEGFEVEDRFVRIGEQIKRVDTYHIPIVISKDLKTEIKLWVVSDRPLDLDETGPAEGEEERETEALPVEAVEEAPEPTIE
ncbi:MAG: 50S ribosomal protein L9 [Planctomycetes bacterium]|jgi:large subunit ribosomal protein L9|nr:50S ribosomal protein L9 [Planctomycetota bacterium]